MTTKIKAARLIKHLTQEETAKSLNITLRHYISIEHEKSEPKVRLAVKLCRLLDLDIYELFG